MKDLIMRLADACGPSGDESNVRALIKEAAAPHADEVREDVLGNLIVTKKGTAQDRKHLMLVAHMDEPGLMVSHVEDNGFLRLIPVGLLDKEDAGYLVGQRVLFPNGTLGIIGTGHVKSVGDVSHAGLFIDIGATSRAEAEERVQVGDFCSLANTAVEVAPNRLAGKALNNRAGCAAAIEVLKNLSGQAHDVSIVFTVQHGVASRGVKTAAFGLQPDFGLVIDAVRTGDTPGASRIEVKLGKGAAVKVLDRTVIVPPRIKHFLVDQAEAADIPFQLEVFPEGSSDAGALLMVQGGVPVGGLSIPVRYGVTGSELIDVRDVAAVAQLATRALVTYA